jgi:hypothetical protein
MDYLVLEFLGGGEELECVLGEHLPVVFGERKGGEAMGGLLE